MFIRAFLLAFLIIHSVLIFIFERPDQKNIPDYTMLKLNLTLLQMRHLLLFFILLSVSANGIAQETSGSFTTTTEQTFSYGYLLHKPAGAKEKRPLLVFLHGKGERGTDLEKLKIHGPLKYIKNKPLDAYVLAPQCPDNAYWDSESLFRLIQKIVAENPIDPDRIYLTGLSMGGWGAWNLAFAHPEMFAALVPIAGYVDRIPVVENCKIAHIPTRIFHGLLDEVLDVFYSAEIYKKLKPCNPNLSLTIFEDAHHDSWTRVYEDPAIYEWMFAQIKSTNSLSK